MGASCVSSSGEKAVLSCCEQIGMVIAVWLGLFLGSLRAREGQCKADDWCVMSVCTRVCAQGGGGHLMEGIWRARASHHSSFHYCSPSRNGSVQCALLPLLPQCCRAGASWKHAFPLQSGNELPLSDLSLLSGNSKWHTGQMAGWPATLSVLYLLRLDVCLVRDW